MGKKRRNMFNKKFQHKNKARWEMGRSKLQKKLEDTGQIKTIDNWGNIVIPQEDNSAVIEKMKETEALEEVSNEEEKVENIDLSKLKKSELLDMADALGCDVTSKNTKAQIIEAIEKQSA